MTITNAKNLSLQKKSAARLAAVQCLYKLAMVKGTLNPEQELSALRVLFFRNPEEQKAQIGVAVEPNYTLLEALLVGVKKHRKEIDEMINSVLSKEWKRERMSHVLIAILQVAIVEYFFNKEAPLKMIQDQYCHLTRSFFGEPEVKFMYASLAALDEKYE